MRRFSIRPSIRSPPGGPKCQALRPAWLALRPVWLALGPSRGGWTDGQTNGRTYKCMNIRMYKHTNVQTDGRKISSFYRTLSPIRAAALLPLKKTKKISFKDKRRAGQGKCWPFDAYGRLVNIWIFPNKAIANQNEKVVMSQIQQPPYNSVPWKGRNF